MLALATYMGHVNINATCTSGNHAGPSARHRRRCRKLCAGRTRMTSSRLPMEAFLRENILSVWAPANTPATPMLAPFSRCSSSAAGKIQSGSVGSDAGAVGSPLVSSSRNIRRSHVVTQRRRVHRLAAIRSFFHFLQHREPTAIEQVRRVLAIPLQENRYSSGIASGPGRNAGFAPCS